jgi:hypothetical protein
VPFSARLKNETHSLVSDNGNSGQLSLSFRYVK